MRAILERILPAYVAATDVRVYVVQSDAWNAEAAANGAIYVHTGLLRDVDDDELAVVLGHELAHYTHEHIRRQMKKPCGENWSQLLTHRLRRSTTTRRRTQQGASPRLDCALGRMVIVAGMKIRPIESDCDMRTKGASMFV